MTSTPGYTNTLTPELTGTTTAGATVDLYAVGSTTPLATTTANALGNFTLTFTGTNDTTYTVDAAASDSVGTSGFSSEVTFTILYGPPPTPTDFALAPSSDTGIVGDDITSDHNARVCRHGRTGCDHRDVRGGSRGPDLAHLWHRHRQFQR